MSRGFHAQCLVWALVVTKATALSEPDAVWAMRQERKTPAYTTDWKHIVEIWR